MANNSQSSVHIKVITLGEDETSLQVRSIVSIDGVKFEGISQGGPEDLEGLQKRLTLVEAALTKLLDDWNDMLSTATVVDDPDVDKV